MILTINFYYKFALPKEEINYVASYNILSATFLSESITPGTFPKD